MITYLMSDIQKSRAKTIEPYTQLAKTGESLKWGSDTPTLADTVTRDTRTGTVEEHSSETGKVYEKG